ncbi:peptidyl-prolyl cis-trans isomerase, EpsD family [Nitrosospira sp. Nsp18]|uniref:EpsD family peptidyl-prolyl cis-trans isomerase n=1 Tax=Nitrosospira sp. Nsp18 TaxID=1855334 RepID=UPI00088D26ED|nr:EpsD family peptidyl-prolyl cis-trans isomerase [Nitrosospira sp. Nsp18]SDA25270.1 peptidyl-prolyl cis-trans isomerase, EpsD family [Nitrosospira sp. Nsp18]
MKLSQKKIILQILSASLALALALGACGSKDTEKPASQIAAKVNSGEISVHQINYILSRAGANAGTPETAPKIRRQILDRLIDQELAVEQAVAKKLDRSPDILMAVENARREILARAYIEQVTAEMAKPTVDEAKQYYVDHPQLFAERRIYNIQEIVVPLNAGVDTELREMLDTGKSMESIADWLKGKGIKFGGGSATRSAEQIPLELLPKIHPLKVGDGLIIKGPQSITVMRLAASQSVPIPEAAALPRIQQFLGNQRAAEAAKQELKGLKEKAKITYMSGFSDTDGNMASQSGAPAASAVKSDVDIGIEKGVAGLK